jgi:hypothetical protein
MLILESVDLAGKSTLFSQLLPKMLKKLSRTTSDGYGSVKTFHYGLLPDSFDYYKDYLKNISVDAISDRFSFSELVYGPILRGAVNPKFDQSRQDMIKLELLVTGSIVLHCQCPLDEIAKRFKERGDENIDKLATFEKIIAGFKELDFGINYVPVDTSAPVSDDLIDKIVESWYHLRQRALSYAKIGGGWGSLDENKLLVIGERPNLDSTADGACWPRPFSVPNPVNKSGDKISSSTDWVLSMLRRVGLHPNDFHVTNVYHTPTTHETRLAEEIDFLKPRKIIVMGTTARNAALNDLGINKLVPVFDMPHPQHLRRFYQSHFEPFCVHLENFVKSNFRGIGGLKEWRPC